MQILETSRLILRELTMEDTGALAEVLSDPETMRYYPAPYDRAGVKQWIERNRRRYQDDGAGLWGMQLKRVQPAQQKNSSTLEDHQIIGDCGIILQQVEGESLYEIGYHLRPENLRSRRVAERVGMAIWKEVNWRGLRHSVYAIEAEYWRDLQRRPLQG